MSTAPISPAAGSSFGCAGKARERCGKNVGTRANPILFAYKPLILHGTAKEKFGGDLEARAVCNEQPSSSRAKRSDPEIVQVADFPRCAVSPRPAEFQPPRPVVAAIAGRLSLSACDNRQ